MAEHGSAGQNTAMNRGATPVLELALYLGIIVAACALYLPDLGLMDYVMEEPRRALIARNMLETGNFWVPTLLGQVYLNKPPFFNWLIALVSLPGGEITPFTARLPSLVSTVMLTLLMVRVTMPFLSLLARVFLAGALLLAAEIMIKTKLAEIEMVYTLLITASLWTWYVSYAAGHRGIRLWTLPGICLSLAFLTKREPALLFFYLAVVPYLLLRRDWRELFSWGHALCIAIILFVASLWLVPVLDQVGLSAYLSNASSQATGVGKPWTWQGALINVFYYPAEAWGSALPWSLLLIPLLSPAVRKRALEGRQDFLYFATLAALLNLAPYVFFRVDLSVRYYLPMVPTAMVIAAASFDSLDALAREGLWSHALRVAIMLVSIASTIIGIGLIVGPYTRYLQGVQSFPLPTAAMAALGLGLIVLAAWSVTRSRSNLRAGILLGLMAFSVGFRLGDMNLAAPHRAVEQQRTDNAADLVAQLRAKVPAIQQPIRVDTHLPFAVWVKAETRLLALPGATETGPYALVETGDAPPLVTPDRCTELKDLLYRGRHLCLISTVRELP